MGIEKAREVIKELHETAAAFKPESRSLVSFTELETILEAYAEPGESEKKQKGGKRGEN